MAERDREKQERTERRKPLRPAENRCSACGRKVPDPADDDAHVCVPDGTDETGKKFRATTMREAREKRAKDDRD